jgi:hypothetical protein
LYFIPKFEASLARVHIAKISFTSNNHPPQLASNVQLDLFTAEQHNAEAASCLLRVPRYKLQF